LENLWENRSGVVSTQVLQELAVNLRRKAKNPLDAKATRDLQVSGAEILYSEDLSDGQIYGTYG
jgi:predicted nucleic acid-binding protein